jgi:hypothetical protein
MHRLAAMRAAYHGNFYDPDGVEIDAATWASLNTPEVRRVARTSVGAITVSTVWLGINHNVTTCGDPLIFETAVFDEAGETGAVRRYATREQAERGHAEVVALVRTTTRES